MRKAGFAVKRGIRRTVLRAPFNIGRQLLFFINYGRFFNLRNPRTFNEKIQWRATKDRRPKLVMASSKVASKAYVGEVAPDLAKPRTLWHGDRVADLLQQDPGGPWVLKASHRSGCVFFGVGAVHSAALPKNLQTWLRDTEWSENRLWAYSQVRREFILEERLPSQDGLDSPDDFKFFVFDGRVTLIQVDRGRRDGHTRVLFDRDWNKLPYVFSWPMGDFPPPAAALAGRMLSHAEKLGQGWDFVRVDLYLVEQTVFFGELTVYPAAGFSHWPTELDRRIGKDWTLPKLEDL